MYKKATFILVLFTIICFSCRSKKQADCPSFDIEEDIKKEETKKRSKYRIVILKDGKTIFKRKKRKKKEKMF
tara:strand:+ start:470 stop:685 length:216 start_codon:yes stop_codon:yes gene_type:complete